ncbi:MAG: PilZ domain-containing protein [Pseudomonadota bacterium]
MNRRKQKRYPVHDGVFVVLNPAESPSKLGIMIDISEGGLSFQYIDTVDSKQTYTELDVFVSGHGIKIDGIPFAIASNIVFQKSIPSYSVITRRLGVKFKLLSDIKNTKISSFIHNHGVHDHFPDNPA